MTPEMIEEIKALAIKYGFDVDFSCGNCDASTQTIYEDHQPSEFVTFTPISH